MSEKHDDQINVDVDGDAKELAKDKLGHGGLSRVVRERIEEIAYGEEVSKHTRLEQRLQSLREQKDELRAQRREVDAEIEDVEQEITRIEEQLSHLDKREDKYDAALEMLEETLAEGGRVFPDHGQVIRAARIGGVDEEHVIADLQERNPSVPEHAFVSKLEDSREWNGTEAEGVPR